MTPLGGEKKDIQAQFTILSEFGMLGFAIGYSLENPNMQVLWEAQFRDLVNSAPVMIKWLQQRGLTMLLPHGYTGQGA